jgi:hypothetical protein
MLMLLLVSSTHTHKLLAKANQQPKKLCGALWRSVALGLRVCEGLNYAKKNKKLATKRIEKNSSRHTQFSPIAGAFGRKSFATKTRIPLNSESATFGICGRAWSAEAVCDGSVWWTIPDDGMHSV